MDDEQKEPRKEAPKDGEGYYPLDWILRRCGYSVRKGGGSKAVKAEPMTKEERTRTL